MTEELSPEAATAWQAYRSMCTSKDDYFSLLQELDEKYQPGSSPSIAENLKLEQLLGEHDRKVKSFNQAVKAITDADARQQLMELLKLAAASEAGH